MNMLPVSEERDSTARYRTDGARGPGRQTKPIVRQLCFYNDPANGNSPKCFAEQGQKPAGRNYNHRKVSVPIRDIRDSEQSFTIDDNSFAPHAGTFDTSFEIDWNLDHVVRDIYLLWVEEFVQANVPGATKILTWDYAIRKASKIKTAARQVNKIHIDQSFAGAFRRAHHHLSPEEAEHVSSGLLRFRIINVWKPMKGPVSDHPLVFADHRSDKQGDIVEVPQK